MPPLENLSIECKGQLLEFGFVSKVVDCQGKLSKMSTLYKMLIELVFQLLSFQHAQKFSTSIHFFSIKKEMRWDKFMTFLDKSKIHNTLFDSILVKR